MSIFEKLANAVVTASQLERVAEAMEIEHEQKNPAPVEIVILREFAGENLSPEVFAAIMFSVRFDTEDLLRLALAATDGMGSA